MRLVPLYFAYGSNMDVAAMASRCPRSKPVGPARLPRHRLAVMREGWLTATRDARGEVHGVLWDVAFADIPALDRHEELASGLYAKVSQPVIAASGPKRALIYFGSNSGPGAVKAGYIADVLRAARAWALPAAAIARLEALAAQAGVVEPSQAASTREAAAPGVRPLFATPRERA
jgi:hypothetical protein